VGIAIENALRIYKDDPAIGLKSDGRGRLLTKIVFWSCAAVLFCNDAIVDSRGGRALLPLDAIGGVSFVAIVSASFDSWLRIHQKCGDEFKGPLTMIWDWMRFVFWTSLLLMELFILMIFPFLLRLLSK
jgi:hypothetical protein